MPLGGQTRAEVRSQLRSVWRHHPTHYVSAGIMVFLGTVVQSPAQFVYDAATYWAGAVSLANGRDPYVDGGLTLRGLLTSVLYVPAALATRAFGDAAGGMAVLVQNSLLVSLIGVLVVPRLLQVWVRVTPRMLWMCAGLTWLLVGRLAPYPLTDLWAAALMLCAVVALRRRSALALMGAGLLAGIVFNVRPAYLAALLLTLVVVLWHRGFAGLWVAAGAGVALAPQSIMNLTHGFGWTPWPPGMPALMGLQASLASYVVRYDTAAYWPARDPRQFFCSNAMAHAVGEHPPESTGGLAASYVQNLPESLVFVAEKATASLHWPLSAPYLAPTGAGDQIFALLVTTVAVLGVVSLAHAQSRSGFRSASVAVCVALAVWLGSLATIVTSEPETRFAVPLVLIGIAGCALIVQGKLGIRWFGSACVAVALVFAIGTAGLSHPAPPGPESPATCAVR